MNGDARDLPPAAPLLCDGFRARVHFRHELAARERREFESHGARCRPCAQLLLEVERLDDLLLQWSVPARPEPAPAEVDATGGSAFEARVVRALRGEGPTASCTEASASLHHFVAGDLEPWIAARVERHLARCAGCRDHLDEVQHSRKIWLAWRAPDPPADFADRLVRRLEPATRAARRRRALLDYLVGAVPVPRVAAALVLASLTLLALGVFRTRGRPPQLTNEINSAAEDAGMRSVLPARYEPAIGRSDPTDSFSPELRAGRVGSLKRTLRGR